MILGINVLTKRQTSAVQNRLTSGRFILMPARRRKLNEQSLKLRGERR